MPEGSQYVRIDGDRLVHQGGPDIASLEQLRAHLHAHPFRGALGTVQDRRGQLAAARDLVVEVMTPIDLDHVKGDQVGVPGAQLEGQLDDQRVRRAAVEAQHDAVIGRMNRGVGHGRTGYTRYLMPRVESVGSQTVGEALHET